MYKYTNVDILLRFRHPRFDLSNEDDEDDVDIIILLHFDN